MPLIEDTLFGHVDKVQKAIDRLKAFAPPEGYYLAFSGGKDSQCIYHLAKRAGVKFDAHYSVTGVDPPQLCQFIKKQYPDVKWDFHFWSDGKPEHYFSDGRPKQITMWSAIADHTIPPTRQARYCCTLLKESGGGGRVVVTGVRWDESQNRKKLHGVADIQTRAKKLHAQAEQDPSYRMNKNGGINFMDDNDVGRQMVEQCYAKNKTTINPIVDWTDEDVWEFLNDVAKVPHCVLYDPPWNYTRLGCIGCPLHGREGMLRDFELFPKYKALYIKAFDRMIANHPGEIKVATGEMVGNTSGGVQRYTQDGSLGMPDGFGNEFVQATSESGNNAGERERETWAEPSHQQMAQVQERQTDLHSLDQPIPLNKHGKPLTHTSADRSSHTERRTERNCLSDGCGCTDSRSAIPDLLAMALPQQPSGQRTKAYNPDPRVADFSNADEVLEFWLGAYND